MEHKKRTFDDFNDHELDPEEQEQVRKELKSEGYDVSEIESQLLNLPRDHTIWLIFIRMDVPTITRLCSVSSVIHQFCHDVLGYQFWRAVVIGDLFLNKPNGTVNDSGWKDLERNFDEDDSEFWKKFYRSYVSRKTNRNIEMHDVVLDLFSRRYPVFEVTWDITPLDETGDSLIKYIKAPRIVDWTLYAESIPTQRAKVITRAPSDVLVGLPEEMIYSAYDLQYHKIFFKLVLRSSNGQRTIMDLGIVDSSKCDIKRRSLVIERGEASVELAVNHTLSNTSGRPMIETNTITIYRMSTAAVCRLIMDPEKRLKALVLRKSDIPSIRNNKMNT